MSNYQPFAIIENTTGETKYYVQELDNHYRPATDDEMPVIKLSDRIFNGLGILKLQVLATLLLLLISFTASAQMTLEHSYPDRGQLTIVNLEDIGYKYFGIDVAKKLIYISNENHSSYKTITVSVPVNHVMGAFYLPSTKLFNSDSDIEICIAMSDTSSASTVKNTLHVIKENGSLIQTIPGCAAISAHKVSNDMWKATAMMYRYNPFSYYYDVYALPGSLPTVGILPPGGGNGGGSAEIYPNPMSEAATLSYSLPAGVNSGVVDVYSANGVKMRSYQVTSHFSNILIQRNELPAGVYVYRLTTANGAGAAERFVIQ